MTTRALATKLRRRENQAKIHPDWDDTADSSPSVILPPVDEFRVLPLDEQKRLLLSWRPTPCKTDLPYLQEFEKLPVQQRICPLAEAMLPPDPYVSACFNCLPLSEKVTMCRGERFGSRP
jgi:hypothetical protein